MMIRALLLSVLMGILPGIAVAETITLVADKWCPYNCEPESDQPGFMVEIARTAFGRHGIDVKYHNVSWSRAISTTRKGKYHAIVGAASGDAPDFIFPAEAQGLSIMAFYTHPKNAWSYKDMGSLKEVTLGAIADYSYSDGIDAYLQKHMNDRARVQLVTGEKALEQNVRKLRNRRIGTLIEDANVMRNFLIKTGQLEDIREAGILDYTRGFEEQLLYVAFSPKHKTSKRYADLLSQETARMRETGELEKILDKYGLRDWKDMTKP